MSVKYFFLNKWAHLVMVHNAYSPKRRKKDSTFIDEMNQNKIDISGIPEHCKFSGHALICVHIDQELVTYYVF